MDAELRRDNLHRSACFRQDWSNVSDSPTSDVPFVSLSPFVTTASLPLLSLLLLLSWNKKKGGDDEPSFWLRARMSLMQRHCLWNAVAAMCFSVVYIMYNRMHTDMQPDTVCLRIIRATSFRYIMCRFWIEERWRKQERTSRKAIDKKDGKVAVLRAMAYVAEE